MRSERVAITPPMLADFPELFAPLRDRGLLVEVNSGPYPLDAAALASFLGDALAAVVGLDELSASVFAACPRLRVVARNGVGMDNVELDAATRRGVMVTAPLGANSTSVAELALGLLIALARRVLPNHERVQRGIWQRDWGTELAGKTLGLVGLGRIGKKVALRAQALEMTVVATDIAPDLEFAARHGIQLLALEDLLAGADVVSLHVPLTPLTHHLLNERRLSWLRPGAYLINTARGPVVDPAALALALDSGRLAGAALDVHSEEGRIDETLRGRPNVITTTHLGAYTVESLRRTTELALSSIVDVLEGRRPQHLVNEELWP